MCQFGQRDAVAVGDVGVIIVKLLVFVEDTCLGQFAGQQTRSELQSAASAAPQVKCAAYRRHVASLTQVRNVFARCDTGGEKAKNAAQTSAALAEFTKQMRESCRK